MLAEAHDFASQMANVIIEQCLEQKSVEINPSFLQSLEKQTENHAGADDTSAHGIPPQIVIENLLQATEDMLTRVEEKAQSVKNPDHKLTEDEMQYVLKEFFYGTNALSVNAIKDFFAKNTKVGGIISGGGIYVEIVKEVVERYGENSFGVDTFMIAVDKQQEIATYETAETDTDTQAVILADDMIDQGDTMRVALENAGEKFPNAMIHSGQEFDRTREFEIRRKNKVMERLDMPFQDFASLLYEGKKGEAFAIFEKAKKYADKNGVELTGGWYILKEKAEKNGEGGA